MSQLSADCLIEIFEYLQDDKISLFSCLLVNKLWSSISVRFLWKDCSNYNGRTYNTLVTCLPNESKAIIFKNKFSPQNFKTPTFNYASYCKVLSTSDVQRQFQSLFRSPINFNEISIILKEIFKLFMRQIVSLKELEILSYDGNSIINFTSFPGAENCLKNITELRCSSKINSEIFYHLTQYCDNIQSLTIEFNVIISNELIEFLSSTQKTLKYFYILQYGDSPNMTNMFSSFTTQLFNTINKLLISNENISFSFIKNFINLQELEIEFYESSELFKNLVFCYFPHLKIFKIDAFSVNFDLAITFLENNGKNLEELFFCELSGERDNSLNLAIAKFCTNLKVLSTGFDNDELETLKTVLNACHHLENIKIWLGDLNLLDEEVALKAIINYSPKNLNRIELLYHHQSYTKKLPPEELDSFFINWSKRVPYFPITILIRRYYNTKSIDTEDENLKIIDKYMSLNVIKQFIVKEDPDEDYFERAIAL